ncbi:FAD-dependent oxidoreductase [Pedobacter cryophilus]|uniref:FAD-dependent oxidoreductase n=1 Tax=Pedobacter cryophilus TaxID=2571271 RepID=A0A4V5NXV7_9SPHI|nr:FAD-dependent oxidoreductase [Pedobacter cryophilus]TKC00941.1 FAD-dependent oxidoreductase [Pedobacter cryophilus]
MIKKFIWIIFLILSIGAQAQYKPDVIILGGTAAGTAAAIQAARSGVKTLLINPSTSLIGETTPEMNIAAFDTGLWKEWKDKYKKASDSTLTDPRNVLAEMVKNTKDLQYLSATEVSSITERKDGWEVKVIINGKAEEIKCKVLVDATTNLKVSPLAQNNIINYDKDGKFTNLVNYNQNQQTQPYEQLQKLYRTSGAAGFGKDSLSIYYIPLGVFIPQEKENLLIVSMAAFRDFAIDDFRNIALWMNMGQAVGALAAYGPFFDTTPSKANIRLTQGEMFTYKSFLYPALDIKTDDYAWYPVQKVIASGILRLDFKTGLFNPNETVKAIAIKAVMAELFPRSRIWFIENKVDDLTVANAISLLSFVSGRDPISIQQELAADWKNKYTFNSDFKENQLINKVELAVLLDAYLAPFNIRIDFNGYFLR